MGNTQRRRRWTGLLPAAAIAISVLAAPSALAHTPVTCSIAGSLQAAIDAAPPGATIAVAPGVCVENLAITKDLTLEGAGMGLTTIDGSSAELRVVYVSDSAVVTIRDLTVANGSATQNVWPNTAVGGGLLVRDARVTLERVEVTNNTAIVYGGGIAIENGHMWIYNSHIHDNHLLHPGGTEAPIGGGGIGAAFSSTMLVSGSTINANEALGPDISGGGIYNGAVSTIINSTIAGNQATAGGGGILNVLPLTIANSTISANHTLTGSGGGVLNVGNELSLEATIIAHNSAPTGPDCAASGVGSNLLSFGFNVVRDGDGCAINALASDFIGTGLVPVEPLLGPLATNGGPTPTMTIDPSSPAVDLVPEGSCASQQDQRLQRRPLGAGCDAGALELNTVPVTASVSLWDGVVTPSAFPAYNPAPVELGVTFTATTNGTITGIRFHKQSNNFGPHTINLWDAAGNRLATATTTHETPTGWQQATFPTPVAIAANTTYTASYHAPNGYYSYASNYFTTPWTNGPLNATASVYRYGATSAHPTHTYNNTNYWVDPIFTPNPPGGVVVSLWEGATPSQTLYNFFDVELGVTFHTTVDGTITGIRFHKQPYGAALHLVTLWDTAGNQLATATTTHETDSGWQQAIFTTPVAIAASTTYTASYHVAAHNYTYTAGYFATDWDNGPVHATSGVFRYAPASAFPTSTYNATNYWVDPLFLPDPTVTASVSLWNGVVTPSAFPAYNPAPVELGVTFTATTNGTITGIRFHKQSNNFGPHTINLWDAAGNRLATATTTHETPTGWQQATFPTPVAIAANTTYTASYHAPNGYYSYASNYFTTPWTNGPLNATASVYRYGATSAHPTHTYNNTNYWVDPIFTPAPAK